MKERLLKLWTWCTTSDAFERVFWTAIQAACAIAAAYQWDPQVGVAVAALIAWLKVEAKKRLAKR